MSLRRTFHGAAGGIISREIMGDTSGFIEEVYGLPGGAL